MVAKEYGQSPGQVREWSQRDFDEAIIILQATNRDKWPLDAGDVQDQHPLANVRTLLDHDEKFWRFFVVGGALNAERLAGAGYGENQIPWLESEMRKLGWL